MGPFIVFIIILVAIWTLSGIATAVSKQKEAERRRRMALQLQRAAMQQRSSPAAPARRISEGIAARFPDVLLPPVPSRQQPPRRAMPPRVAPLPAPPRRLAAPKQRRPAQQRRTTAAPPPAAAMSAMNIPRESAPLSTAAPAVESSSHRPSVASVDASQIARWAKPATLRQQFILTEIFQPPLTLRDPR